MKNEAVSLISITTRRLAKAIVFGSSAVAFFAVAAQRPDGGLDQDATERQGAESASTLSTAFLKPDFSRRDPIVLTDKGRVRGYFSEAGVATFLGIPYAKPPVGNLRWRPPEAPSSWSNTLETKQFSPICAQITTLTVFAGPINYNEDCLYLNVFTPNTKPNRKLPVLVWIHGGGNFDGEANDYDPTKLVIQGNLVVVTFNYRLGLLGWLAHPALDSEGHQFGNYGLLDQQAVLRWVKSNVASFGGDPDNVTLGGQSAGSYDTSANMVSPLAKGLFHRAILQSLFGDSKPLASAREIGKQFATAAGCDSGASVEVANCLRNLPASTIMNIQGTPQDSGSLTIINNISDGTIVPSEGVFAKIKNGEFSRVPVLSGMTHDEFNFGFVAVAEYWSKPRAPITTAQYTNWAWSTFGQENGNKILEQFPLSAYQTPQFAWNAAGTGWMMCPHYAVNRTLSQYVPLYAYEYNYQKTPSYLPKMPGFEPLAYHTGDIQFLFQYYHGGPKGIPRMLSQAEQAMSSKLVRAWSYFAYTGNPNGQGDSPWPKYVASATHPSYYLSEDVPDFSLITDTTVSQEHKCSFWAALPPF